MEALNASVRLAKRDATPLVGIPTSSFALSEVVKALLAQQCGEKEAGWRQMWESTCGWGGGGSHHHRPLSGCCREGGHLLLPVESLRGGPLHWTTVGRNKPLQNTDGCQKGDDGCFEMRKRRVSHVGRSRRREINTRLYYYVILWVLF